MAKRERDDGVSMADAIQLLCCRPAHPGEADGLSLTPLEKQVVGMKQDLPGHVILLVACGYRVKVYGRDSHVVSRRCGIMCIPGQPFEYSSVPYTRVNLYIHRLVAMGYHVGFADQESAAMRAVGGVRSGIFARTVSRLYSRGTLLPSERVATNGDVACASTGGGGVSASHEEEEAGEEDLQPDGGDGEEAVASAAPSGGPLVDASELFMCFVHALPATIATTSPASCLGVRLVLISFVTQRREVAEAQSPLELEDLLHRYDIVEVVLLAAAATRTRGLERKQAQGSPGSQGGIDTQGDTAPSILPEAFMKVLHHTLSLHLGPTTNGEEDTKTVGCVVHRHLPQQSMDAAIEAYLEPYALGRVYAQMASHAPVAVAAAAKEEPQHARTLSLPGTSLRALDVFSSGVGPSGSLLALLNHSITACGARRLRAWTAAPSAELSVILRRQGAVTYLVGQHDAGAVEGMLRECARVGDTEATLGKLHSQRCGVLEYVRLLRMVRSVCCLSEDILQTHTDGAGEGGTPVELPDLISEVLQRASSPQVRAFLTTHAAEVNTTATTPLELLTTKGAVVPAELQEHIAVRDAALSALESELISVRRVLRLPGLEYRTISGTPFTIDIPGAKAGGVPAEWTVLSRTKANVRLHTPVIIRENLNLCAARERLAAAATQIWQRRQEDLTACSADMNALACILDTVSTLDVLRSLAITSSAAGYVAPRLVDVTSCRDASTGIVVRDGRHPMLDRLLASRYVACDAIIRVGSTWLLTGPNMGGKSAFMRMMGMFVVMAQLGCYVPAREAYLPVFRGLYCRMGASDSILEGSSTFLTEMDETSRILRAPNLAQSLVLMDELGRGTSSFDGVAVAAATLAFLVEQRVTALFVTHYSNLCDDYVDTEASGNQNVECYYMGFKEVERVERDAAAGGKGIVFTYKPCKGISPSSFGVEVAALAGLPVQVTEIAGRLSAQQQALQCRRVALGTVARLIR